MAEPYPGPQRREILLVDDSPIVIKAISRVLRRDHDVTAAGNGQEALDLIRSGRTFDAIVCDVAMPNLSGIDLYKVLVKEHPALARRFMFATGGAETLRGITYLIATDVPVLLKPFTASALREALDGLLGRERS